MLKGSKILVFQRMKNKMIFYFWRLDEFIYYGNNCN